MCRFPPRRWPTLRVGVVRRDSVSVAAVRRTLLDRVDVPAERALCAAAINGANAVVVGTCKGQVITVDLDDRRSTVLFGHTNQVRSGPQPRWSAEPTTV